MCIIKPAPGPDDLYVVWSRVADGPVCIGGREPLTGELLTDYPMLTTAVLGEMFADADELGSSSREGFAGWHARGWRADRPLPERRFLPRGQLVPYTMLLVEGRADEALALTLPWRPRARFSAPPADVRAAG